MISSFYNISQSWKDFPNLLGDLIKLVPKNGTIIEIGGGANPTLSEKKIKEKNIKYLIVDINQQELDKAEGTYFEKLCQDITVDKWEHDKADLVITHMLLEHIKNPLEFHTSCLKLLKTKGKAIHFFATLFSIASITNLVLPEFLSKRLLYAIQKRRWETEGKFPAYYRWSKGPTKNQISRFEKLGFRIELYNGYLGHNYFARVALLKHLEKMWNWTLMRIRSPYSCSNAIVVLQKP